MGINGNILLWAKNAQTLTVLRQRYNIEDMACLVDTTNYLRKHRKKTRKKASKTFPHRPISYHG